MTQTKLFAYRNNLRLKEELKAEKKSGFWDTLVLKQNIQPKKPDQIEGWEPPKLTAEDVAADAEDGISGCPPWSGWEDDTKGSTKYTSLANSASSSRWSLRSAGKLVSIRRQSKGHLTDTCEELEWTEGASLWHHIAFRVGQARWPSTSVPLICWALS